ncbi:MAG: hypothetical protein IJE73_03300 [Muribaculaceae bacterium]|nr:hypothetical protein [Muribaculaceae bacterium]
MWLTNSSIGRKLIMSITGACLILFLTFHVLMNAVAIVWPTAYNTICQLLGANWYALVASMGLAALFVLHIVYAFILTLQNRKARGNDRYNVTTLPPHVEWSSNNMLVLGIVVVAFLVVHMIQFWAKMQLVEALSHDPATWAVVDGAAANPAMGTLFIHAAFSEVWTPIVYIIGFVALWFHMNHGFWSMFQTAGWNNDTWLPRLKKVACWWTTIVVGLFTIQAVWFTYQAKENAYLNDKELQEQYFETYVETIQHDQEAFQSKAMEIQLSGADQSEMAVKMAELQKEVDAKSTIMTNAIKVFCKDLPQVKALIRQEEEMQKMQQQAPMGGGEEVIADSAAVDTTNVKLQN